MLAILGHLVTTAGVRLPGNIAFDLPFAKVPTGKLIVMQSNIAKDYNKDKTKMMSAFASLGISYLCQQIND